MMSRGEPVNEGSRLHRVIAPARNDVKQMLDADHASGVPDHRRRRWSG
jgi:hypothetical protein